MKVLLVEDDAWLVDALRRVFSEEGHTVDVCSSGAIALARGKSTPYDVVVLDWMLPDGEGIAVCEGLRRARCDVPILMLTARAEVADRVRGLRSGADDYLVKPFEVEELLARVEALARRASTGATLVFGDLQIHRLARRAVLAGAHVDLTPREFDLLDYLAAHAGKVVAKKQVLEQVWNLAFDPGTNVVEVTLSRLRDKLGDAGKMIETVRGTGWRFRAARSP